MLLLVAGYLYLGVVPKFEQMFKSLGRRLAPITVLVLTLSQFLFSYAIVIAAAYAAAIATVALVERVRRSPFAISGVAVHAAGLLLACVAAPLAIFYPIMELERTLAQDPPPARSSAHAAPSASASPSSSGSSSPAEASSSSGSATPARSPSPSDSASSAESPSSSESASPPSSNDASPHAPDHEAAPPSDPAGTQPQSGR